VLAFGEQFEQRRADVRTLTEAAAAALVSLGRRRSGETGSPVGIGMLLVNGAFAEAATDLARFVEASGTNSPIALGPATDALLAIMECEALATGLASAFAAMDDVQRSLLRAVVPSYPVVLPHDTR
jgi:hypothetical protein